MLRRFLFANAAALVALIAVLAFRTMMFTPDGATVPEPVADAVDGSVLAAHLSQAVRFETVSRPPPAPIDAAQFEGFTAWLEKTYPQAHARLSREVIGGHTLLYRWEGKDPSAPAYLLAAHYDVVPVVPGTESVWKHPPFSGALADGYVWGRGTLDDKSAVVTIMEAVTHLLRQGFEPPGTVYLSFGHDEEVGGLSGAAAVAARLKASGRQLDWSLDEGSFVLDGIVPGIDRPVASVNLAEKGNVTLILTAKGAGGHSAMPPRETSAGVVARAVVALQDQPLPGGLDGLTGESFDALARHMGFGRRLLFANTWLFGGLIANELSKVPAANAALRTTTAPTMLSAGVQENVLPVDASATVNFRLHPRDTPEREAEFARAAISDERVDVRMTNAVSASRVAASDSPAYRALQRTVRRVFGDVPVAPGLTVSGTDSKHYETVVRNAYRFNPMQITRDDLTGFHGIDERLSVENLVRATRFYIELMRSGGR